MVLRGKCGPDQAGPCDHSSSPQTDTVTLDWTLHLCWPLSNPGQSGRSLEGASIQGLQPWASSSVAGASGARETQKGSLVDSGDPSPLPEMGPEGSPRNTGFEKGERASADPL